MKTKKYVKPEIAAVRIPDFIMGDGNLGIASKPSDTDGKVNASKENGSALGTGNACSKSLWDDDEE